MKTIKKNFFISALFISLFIIWTLLLLCIDVRPIGPRESVVGFSSMNSYVHNLIGVNFTLYNITDWLGLVPFCFIISFGIIGFIQWIKRKNILKVDFNILMLGIFYLIVMAVYLFFEIFPINYRPVLINGYLEASYPSSTTMIVMCVIPTTIMQLNSRIKNSVFKKCIILMLIIFIIFMVIGRLISGVHWISDIIGGALFSSGIVILYHSVCKLR